MGKEAMMRKKFLCAVIILLVFFTGNAFGIEILGIHFAPDKEVYEPIVEGKGSVREFMKFFSDTSLIF